MVILNYGVGNLRSISKALENLGVEVNITSTPNFNQIDALILPGVGAFSSCLQHIVKLKEKIIDFKNAGGFIFGICLGLQLLFTKSYEGGENFGLDLIQGDVIRLPETRKLPHIGWNSIKITKNHQLLDGIIDESFFYFVHSYYANPVDNRVVYGNVNYGIKFPAIIIEKNIIATQFHPEKSSKNGVNLLRNYVNIVQR
jgi:glutamine amidotransferase